MSRRPSITQAMRREVAARDGLHPASAEFASTACTYCGTPLLWTYDKKRVRLLDADGRFTPEIDHVVALYHGGPHHPDNLVPACLHCNRSKCHRRLAKQTLERLPKQTLELVLATESSNG